VTERRGYSVVEGFFSFAGATTSEFYRILGGEPINREVQ
jgi:hypothetical protein